MADPLVYVSQSNIPSGVVYFFKGVYDILALAPAWLYDLIGLCTACKQ